jgi:uncharacterized protein
MRRADSTCFRRVRRAVTWRGMRFSGCASLVEETRLEVPGVNVGVTGGGVLELDEMKQSQTDSILATLLALVLVGIIFVFGYHETGRPLKAMFCLLIGLCYSMGYTTLTVGRLNILTITFAPMLVGMAIDFGVHLITRYEEELRKGIHQKLALRKAMVNTGEGIFTGAFTTAGAFFAMSFTDFAGVREMGIITGGGLIVCLIPMMTMLPTMLLKGRQNRLDRGHRDVTTPIRERMETLVLQHPWAVTILGLLLSGLCLTQFNRVPFDYDLRNMQSKDLPAVVYEKKLMDSTPRSVLFGAVVASNALEAVRLQAMLTNLHTVADVDSIAPLLVQEASPKLAQIDGIRTDLATLKFPEPTDALPDLAELDQTLFFLQSYLGQAADAVQKEAGQTNLLEQLRGLRSSIGSLRSQITHGDRQQNRMKLAAFERAFFEDLRNTFATLQNQDASSALRAEDLPDPIRNRFVGRTGKFLLQVYPKIDVWIRTNQLAFVQELRGVVPEVTGDPVQLLEYTTLLKVSYERAAWYALGAMVLLVYVQFRSVRVVLLAHVPVALAGNLAGRADGPLRRALQSRQHHDPAAGRRHRGHLWRPHPDPFHRGTKSRHPRQKHRQSRARVRTYHRGRLRQSDPRQTPGHREPGLCDVRRGDRRHAGRPGVPPRAADAASPAGPRQKRTQRHQCTSVAGPGGTEAVDLSQVGLSQGEACRQFL